MTTDDSDQIVGEVGNINIFRRPDGSEYFRLKETARGVAWASRSWLEVLRENGVQIDYQTMIRIWSVFDDRLEFVDYLIVAAAGSDIDETVKWIVGPLAAVKGRPDQILNPFRLREFVIGLTSGKFPRHFAKEIFDELLAGFDFANIIAQSKYQETTGDELGQAVDAIIAANPEKAAEARQNPKMIQWFVGQVLKQKKGLPPAKVLEQLKARLQGDE